MPTVITTPGAANANSYCSVAEADAYHVTHLYASSWTRALVETKETALIMATRLLDAMYEWDQFPTDDVQALDWPRSGVMAANQLEYLFDDEIPLQLKNATAEFARQLIEADRTGDNAIESYGLSSLSAGPVSLSFRETIKTKVIPDAVYYLLPAWWGRIRGQAGIRELLRS